MKTNLENYLKVWLEKLVFMIFRKSKSLCPMLLQMGKLSDDLIPVLQLTKVSLLELANRSNLWQKPV
ncbi:MAG: hypothetical protein TH68_06420 [Candidatus Synechococcus spongiarum 142]|uniref:Uncharacterized protein n=1 Tax=Candidatus Synechococcus spongiarum 142 TaxID=1608213 RepID=A0A6N3X362_9SYNE|nr:MAG: hypothetical protein TH68_06420 [Candidatus Synechococcus spongiarum 142]